MRKLTMIMVVMTIFCVTATAQLGNIKDAKDKVSSTSDEIGIGKNKKDKGNKNVENTTADNNSATIENSQSVSSTNNNTESSPTMDNGKGYFYTTFKSNGFKTEVSIGDELFVRMNLGKTMIEFADENGFESSYSAYGYITVYIDNQKQFVAGPYTFASNISKKWTHIDIPINVKPDFGERLAADQSQLETNQDVWVFQHLYQEKNVPTLYTTAAIGKMTGGTYELKVEFGLGESSSSEPMITICTGTVKIKVDEAGAEALAMNGPKHLRPLKAEEKGEFITNTKSYTPGNSELNVKLQLPNPPKYYNEKWCQATSCDYDHGSMLFYVSIDGMPVTHWEADLWEADYESLKEFSFIILPLIDSGYGNMDASYNSNKIYKGSSPIVYALLDMLYGGIIKVGNHKLTIKAYSQESVPLNMAYEFENSYFAQFPSIAETTIDFIVTEEGLNKLINGSSAKKLSHAGGDWSAIDSKLISANTGNPNMQILDVACQTEWKVVTNAAGVILYRECKADVLYKSEYGYRVEKSVGIKADYMGGGTYGSPYFNERINADHGPSLLGTMHLPVPFNKVK